MNMLMNFWVPQKLANPPEHLGDCSLLMTACATAWLMFPTWQGVLTWIWDASCAPRLAFRAAPPGRGQGWGWWWGNDHSPCRRSSTSSPGAGDVPPGSCWIHKHNNLIQCSMATKCTSTKRQATNSVPQAIYSHTVLQVQGWLADRIPLPSFEMRICLKMAYIP